MMIPSPISLQGAVKENTTIDSSNPPAHNHDAQATANQNLPEPNQISLNATSVDTSFIRQHLPYSASRDTQVEPRFDTQAIVNLDREHTRKIPSHCYAIKYVYGATHSHIEESKIHIECNEINL